MAAAGLNQGFSSDDVRKLETVLEGAERMLNRIRQMFQEKAPNEEKIELYETIYRLYNEYGKKNIKYLELASPPYDRNIGKIMKEEFMFNGKKDFFMVFDDNKTFLAFPKQKENEMMKEIFEFNRRHDIGQITKVINRDELIKQEQYIMMKESDGLFNVKEMYNFKYYNSDDDKIAQKHNNIKDVYNNKISDKFKKDMGKAKPKIREIHGVTQEQYNALVNHKYENSRGIAIAAEKQKDGTYVIACSEAAYWRKEGVLEILSAAKVAALDDRSKSVAYNNDLIAKINKYSSNEPLYVTSLDSASCYLKITKNQIELHNEDGTIEKFNKEVVNKITLDNKIKDGCGITEFKPQFDSAKKVAELVGKIRNPIMISDAIKKNIESKNIGAVEEVLEKHLKTANSMDFKNSERDFIRPIEQKHYSVTTKVGIYAQRVARAMTVEGIHHDYIEQSYKKIQKITNRALERVDDKPNVEHSLKFAEMYRKNLTANLEIQMTKEQFELASKQAYEKTVSQFCKENREEVNDLLKRNYREKFKEAEKEIEEFAKQSYKENKLSDKEIKQEFDKNYKEVVEQVKDYKESLEQEKTGQIKSYEVIDLPVSSYIEEGEEFKKSITVTSLDAITSTEPSKSPLVAVQTASVEINNRSNVDIANNDAIERVKSETEIETVTQVNEHLHLVNEEGKDMNLFINTREERALENY